MSVCFIFGGGRLQCAVTCAQVRERSRANVSSAIRERARETASGARPPATRMASSHAPHASEADASLQAAALAGDEPALRRALDAGASPDAQDEHGWTALHNAMLSGAASLGIATVLVEAGASANVTTAEGETALHLVHEADPKVDWKVTSGRTTDGRSSFFAASIIQVLVSAGASVNATSNDGSTALHLAAEAGASSSVMALLHCGADVAAADYEGRTALQRAGKRAAGALTVEHAVRLRGLLKAAAEDAVNVEGFSLCDEGAVKGEAADVLCRTDDDSDDENAVMSWADALAAVPRELPARLYGSPPKERRAPLSPSRKRSSAHANIYPPEYVSSPAANSPGGAPKTPKSARGKARLADLENFSL